MKIRQILKARSIRQVASVQTLDYRPDTIKKLQERYGFLKVPTTFDELFGTKESEGIQFHHGKFTDGSRTFVIDLLQFLPGVILADVRTSTEDAELFLDDYIKRANETRADTITTSGPTMYMTQLEFTMDRPLEMLMPKSVAIGSAIDAHLQRYGIKSPPFVARGIIINLDPVGLGGFIPSLFAIERRKDFPHSANVYFSQAPLKTSDHQSLLENIEQTMGA